MPNASLVSSDLLLQILASVFVFALLVGAALLGLYLRPRLPEAHRSRESLELVRIITGMIVTFAALVIGLLVSSAKTSYETSEHELAAYAYELRRFDQCLRNYGPDADPLRGQLHSYTAAMIASTWPEEPPPAGADRFDISAMGRSEASPTLGSVLDGIGIGLHRLRLGESLQAMLAADCSDQFKTVMTLRGRLNDDQHSEASTPFYVLLVSWLIVVFMSFGLLSPYNSLVFVAIMLCALILSSALFTIRELDQPYFGIFNVSSAGMRHELAGMVGP